MPSLPPPRPPTRRGRTTLPRRPGVGATLQRHPFSGENVPLGALAFDGTTSTEQADLLTHLKFENRLRLFQPEDLYIIRAPGSSYPGGNFGGNQLLLDDRFARQNCCEPPPEFPLASPSLSPSCLLHSLQLSSDIWHRDTETCEIDLGYYGN